MIFGQITEDFAKFYNVKYYYFNVTISNAINSYTKLITR